LSIASDGELNMVTYLYQEHLPDGIKMKNTLNALFIRIEYIWQEEGLIPLLRSGLTFLAEHTFQYGTFYLYEYKIKEEMRLTLCRKSEISLFT